MQGLNADLPPPVLNPSHQHGRPSTRELIAIARASARTPRAPPVMEKRGPTLGSAAMAVTKFGFLSAGVAGLTVMIG